MNFDAAATEAFLAEHLPMVRDLSLRIVSAGKQGAVVAAEAGPALRRPGNIVAGPALFGLADVAIYVAILAVAPHQRMAVTVSMTMNFIRPAPVGGLTAEAVLNRMGRRLAFADVRIRAGDVLVATGTGSYALEVPG